eukprot:840084-Amphidinium_carterae.1
MDESKCHQTCMSNTNQECALTQPIEEKTSDLIEKLRRGTGWLAQSLARKTTTRFTTGREQCASSHLAARYTFPTVKHAAQENDMRKNYQFGLQDTHTTWSHRDISSSLAKRKF